MASIFLAVQFEFTHAIGPHAGRYVVANPVSVDDTGAALRAPAEALRRRDRLTGVTMQAATADVLAVNVIGAPAGRSPRLRRRARETGTDETPTEVPLLLATFVRGTQPLDKAEANRRLLAIAEDEDQQQAWVADGLRVVNRAIRAYRIGSRDPYVREVAQRDARAVRIGFGSTDGLPEGNFLRAATLPPPLGFKATKEEQLVPAETTADVLAGRSGLLEGEEVLLRAFMDLDHGRPRAAAVQLRAAIELLAVELTEVEGGGDLRVDWGELATRCDELAAQVMPGPPAESAVEGLETLVADLEHALQAWRYAGLQL